MTTARSACRTGAQSSRYTTRLQFGEVQRGSRDTFLRPIAAICDLVAASLLVVLTGCGLCSDEIVATAASADGLRRATINSRNCGATTAFVNRLNVSVPERSRPVEALVGELCMAAPGDAELRWEGSDLVVTCKKCCPERIQTKISAVGDTKLRFEGFDRPKSR